MIFETHNTEIPRMFDDALRNVLGFDYEDYLAQEGRGFIAFIVSSASNNNELVARCLLDELPAVALMTAANGLGKPDAFGGFFSPFGVKNPPVNGEVLRITQRWLNLDKKGRTAIAYHEACHCFRGSNRFQDISTTSAAYRGGKHYRRFTQYHDNDDFGHDPQWFALLVEKAQVLQSKYPSLFASGHTVIESALSGDIRLCEGEVLPEYKAEVAA